MLCLLWLRATVFLVFPGWPRYGVRSVLMQLLRFGVGSVLMPMVGLDLDLGCDDWQQFAIVTSFIKFSMRKLMNEGTMANCSFEVLLHPLNGGSLAKELVEMLRASGGKYYSEL